MCKHQFPDPIETAVQDSDRLDSRILFTAMALSIIAAFAVIWMVTWAIPQPHQLTNLLTGQDAKLTFSGVSVVPERIKKAEAELKKAAKQGIHKPE